MLTKNDLNSIGTLIDDKLDTKLKPIKKDLREVKRDVKDLIHMYDEESHHVNKRLDRLEDTLRLEPLPKPYEQSPATG